MYKTFKTFNRDDQQKIHLCCQRFRCNQTQTIHTLISWHWIQLPISLGTIISICSNHSRVKIDFSQGTSCRTTASLANLLMLIRASTFWSSRVSWQLLPDTRLVLSSRIQWVRSRESELLIPREICSIQHRQHLQTLVTTNVRRRWSSSQSLTTARHKTFHSNLRNRCFTRLSKHNRCTRSSRRQ